MVVFEFKKAYPGARRRAASGTPSDLSGVPSETRNQRRAASRWLWSRPCYEEKERSMSHLPFCTRSRQKKKRERSR
nr:hypothetical protein Itr_chr14CG09750 [Ipomoea trifida]